MGALEPRGRRFRSGCPALPPAVRSMGSRSQGAPPGIVPAPAVVSAWRPGKRSDGLLAGEDDCCVAWATVGGGERDGLNVALNEATWAGIGVDAAGRRARLLFDVLSLPADGAVAASRPVAVTVNRVSRIAVSLRLGWWDDTAADVIPLELGDLDAIVRSFGGCPVYGWEFIDPPEESWSHWRDRLSVDARFDQEESPHVIDLFQEGGSAQPRHLDLRIWFAQIRITTHDDHDIPLHEFIASGARWWDGLHSGDPRISGTGIFPLRGD